MQWVKKILRDRDKYDRFQTNTKDNDYILHLYMCILLEIRVVSTCFCIRRVMSIALVSLYYSLIIVATFSLPL